MNTTTQTENRTGSFGEVLRNRNFRLLWIGEGISVVATSKVSLPVPGWGVNHIWIGSRLDGPRYPIAVRTAAPRFRRERLSPWSQGAGGFVSLQTRAAAEER